MHLHKEVSLEDIEKTVKEFTGSIKQLPPRKSAVKRQIRQREIYYFKILELEDKDLLFKVGCEAGTYIRKLVDDFGKKIGTGAHMAELIRTKAGPFSIEHSCTLHDIKDAFTLYEKEKNEKEIRKIILPVEKAVQHLPKVWVMDNAVDSLCHGADLSIPGIVKFNDFYEDETIAVMTLKDELISLGIAVVDSSEIMKKDKGRVIKNHKVFMERGLYPRFKL